MSHATDLFTVTVNGSTVRVDRLPAEDNNYRALSEQVILRERDAIQLFRDKKDQGEDLDGIYVFANLENARSYALLQLMTIQERVADNLDEIQAYTG